MELTYDELEIYFDCFKDLLPFDIKTYLDFLIKHTV